MTPSLHIYNTLSRQKEEFTPLNPPHVGLYSCGPTVYGDGHLGHARAAITFDTVFRYLTYLGYKVRYVRNITDVGHLENDADHGEDKIAKKARLEQLEPMEVVQYYTNRYHKVVELLNTWAPSIEPTASGHIIEQISMIEKIIENGFAYEVNGSVYFDVLTYSKSHPYGELSGRNIDDMLSVTRELEGTDEKRHPADFALWKKASPQHIMKWPSPWSEGFPGWHLECSAMSSKYLGNHFDIHGGGMDLQFPHHEAEIAQSKACNHHTPAKYWMHNNMITINGKKMGKSLGNFITIEEFLTGKHPLLEKAYEPMTIRFFILQAHYRSTLDFGNEALQAAEKGLARIQAARKTLKSIQASTSGNHEFKLADWKQRCLGAMNDDFNTPILIAELFDAVKFINSAKAGQTTINQSDLDELTAFFETMVNDVLGISIPADGPQNDLSQELMQTILKLRAEAKNRKDFGTSDFIRDELKKINVIIKDTKDGAVWEVQAKTDD